jgi:hypothetical protein
MEGQTFEHEIFRLLDSSLLDSSRRGQDECQETRADRHSIVF